VPYTVKIDNKTLTLFTVWTKSAPFYYDENVTKAVCSSEYKELVNNGAIIIDDFNTGHSEEYPNRYIDLCENLNEFKNCALGKPEEFKNTFFSYAQNKMYLNDFCFISKTLNTNTKEIKYSIHDNRSDNEYNQKSWHGSDHCPISVDFIF